MSTDEYGGVRRKKLQTTPHPCPISPRCPQCPIGPPQNKIPPPCAGCKAPVSRAAPLRVPPVANKRSAVEPPIQKSAEVLRRQFGFLRGCAKRTFRGRLRYACRLWQTSEAQLSHRSRKARKYCGDSSDFCAGAQSALFSGGSATRAASGKQAKRS